MLGYALGLAAAMGLGTMISAASARPAPQVLLSAPEGAFDPSRFILNGLLAPALDGDALPMRWVDPRPALGCGQAAVVRVNGKPLRPGTLVPDVPFELDWQADGCRPFGLAGPRFDGGVKLTVFKEDWGFSAMVDPRGLRVASADYRMPVRHGTATMPQCIGAEPPTRAIGAPISCR